jgi:hypothetical protein
VALPPTVGDLKTWSRVPFGDLDAPYTDDDLQVRIHRSCDYLTAYTGRPIDSTMPPPLVSIAEEAVQLRVEQVCYQEQPDYVETVNDQAVQSFSAGNYSETRHEPGRSRYAGATTGLPDLNPNAALNRDIWLLCTPAMQEYWRYILQGQGAPAIETTEVDWGNYDALYPYSYGVGMASDPSAWGA